MRIIDWSSDVCSSDLLFSRRIRCESGRCQVPAVDLPDLIVATDHVQSNAVVGPSRWQIVRQVEIRRARDTARHPVAIDVHNEHVGARPLVAGSLSGCPGLVLEFLVDRHIRSEEHTSELQSLMRISYAVFCLKKK